MSAATKYQRISVRYNTKSEGNINTWRVICDGVEYFTNKVVIQGNCNSTSDLMPNGELKHHITVENATVDYSVDYTLIQTERKFLLQDILKTITYRILGTSVTFGIGFIATGNLNVSVALGFSDLILKPIVYFLHERLWRLNRN